MEMTVLGSDPYVTVRGGRQPRHRAGPLRGAPRAERRGDAPRPARPRHDGRHDRRGPAGPDEADRVPPQRRPGRRRRRGGPRRRPARRGRSLAPAIDVYSSEPPAADNPLLAAPNTVLTPHLGASTAEAQVAVAEEAAQQVLEVLDGRPARYAVNAPLLTPETARAIAPYLPLAEMLGRFFAQFSRGGVRTVTLEVAGELAEPRRHAAPGGRAARPPPGRHERAGQPGQRRDPGQGPRDHDRRAQDARRRAVRDARDDLRDRIGRGRADGRRHPGQRRAALRPARRLLARRRPGAVDARLAAPGPARHDRPRREHARRGRRQHQRDAPGPLARRAATR